MQPKYLYKIYDITDTFVKVLDDVLSEPRFTYSLNGGLGELVLELNRSLDNYGEGSDLDFNYKVEVYLTDDYNDNQLIYTGFISEFNPIYQNGLESVSIIVLPNIAKLNNEFYRSGTSVKDDFDITWTTTEIADILDGILDNHRSLVSALYISNDYTNIDDTGNDITITFSQEKHIDAIKMLEKYLDTGWHWYIDASGKFHLEEQSATADHSFMIGKHVIDVNGHKNIEDVINTYFIWNGERSGTIVDNPYSDATSQNNFDNKADLLVDNDITTDAFSNFIGNAKIANDKDSKRQITIVVSGKNYDIASIKPGDTCKILNINASQTLFGENMKVYNIEYTPTEARLDLIGTEIKPVLSTDSKANDIKGVGGITAQTVRDAVIKANAGMHWDGDTLVIEGSIEATSGTIGGWSIGANTLSSVDGDIILDSSTGTANISFYDGVNLAGKIYAQTYAGSSTFTIEAEKAIIYSESGQDVLFEVGTDNGVAGIAYIENVATGYELGSLLIGSDLDRNADSEIIIWTSSIRPATATSVYLGSATAKWQALFLDQLAAGYPATEGAIFTKDDHHIYYRNNTAEVRLDTTDPAGSYLPLSGGSMTGNINLGTSKLVGEAGSVGIYVDSAGYVGIGTTNPSNELHIEYGLVSVKKDADNTYQTPTQVYQLTPKGYVDGVVGDYLPLSGGTMTGAIDMDSNRINNLPGSPLTDNEAVCKSWVLGELTGFMSDLIDDTTPQLGGNLDMNGYNIGGNTEAQLDDAVAKKHTQGSDTTLGTMTQSINMNSLYLIQNLPTPVADGDAVRKKYCDDEFLSLSGGTMAGAINMGGYNISYANYIYDTSTNIAFEISASATVIESWKHINPHSDNAYDLGTSSLRWKDIYAVDINTDWIKDYLGTSCFDLRATDGIAVYQDLVPSFDSSIDIGTSALRYSHIYVDQVDSLLDIVGAANLQLTKAGAIVAVKDAGGTTRYLTCVEDPDNAGHYILYV